MVIRDIDVCIRVLRKSVPPLDGVSYKGQAGKVAVIGGSFEYTGAPYFAAISAMRGGAELSFVYCAESAAQAIKAYSPDIIVYPGFEALGDNCENLNRMHALVLGPGLGRGKEASAVVHKVVRYAIQKRKPLVMDADSLWFVAHSEEIRRDIRLAPRNFQAFMTPNKVEMDRLLLALEVSDGKALVKWFNGHVVLVQKGIYDQIVGKAITVDVTNTGSLKRVGGQGDVLAGLLALCAAWLVVPSAPAFTEEAQVNPVAAAVCACLITRSAAKRAFMKYGRSMLASDILAFVGEAMDEVLACHPP